MGNIIAINNQVFGSKFREMMVSSRTRKRVRSELRIPDSAVEMTYSDMCEVNGGGNFQLSISCTIGGAVSGLCSGLVTGFVVGYIMGKFAKIGTMFGGWVGSLVSLAIGGIAGYCISSVVNDMIYGSGGPGSITLINIWVPFINYNIDIGEKIASAIGGFGGGVGGAALASASGFALGIAS